MNYTFCFRCSYQNKPEKDCPACGGKNRVFGTCFVCPMCEGYGKWCKFCEYKGYLKKKMIKCPSCNGIESNSIVCPLCDNKLMIIDSENAYFVMELTPHSHPSRDTIKQFIFFKNCNHFH